MTYPHIDAAVLRDLAPTGVLRVAVNMANAALVTTLPDGSLAGMIPDLFAALAHRLGVPVEFVRYTSGGAILAQIGPDHWDVAVLAIDPARTNRLSFSRPIAQIDATFAVLDASPLTHVDQADQTDLTIATARGAAYELHLKRSLKHAVIISHDTPVAARDAIRSMRSHGRHPRGARESSRRAPETKGLGGSLPHRPPSHRA
jgi:polar amino acid transport system substrate-binding protein